MKKATTTTITKAAIYGVSRLGLKEGNVTLVFEGKKYAIQYDKYSRLSSLKELANSGLNISDEVEITHNTQNVIEVTLLKPYHTIAPSSNKDNGYTSLKEAFEKMGEAYCNLLKYFVPTRDGIGLTERNMTCYFCHVYSNLHPDNTFVWFELPMKDHQHLDSIIIHINDDNTTDIYFIEAKRIYDVSYITGLKGKPDIVEYEKQKDQLTSSLHKDCIRLLDLKDNEFGGINSLNNIIFEGDKIKQTVRLHLVLIASLEQIGSTKDNTIDERYNTLKEFLGYFGLDKEEIDIRQKHFPQQEVICEIEKGNYVKNLNLYLMHKLL